MIFNIKTMKIANLWNKAVLLLQKEPIEPLVEANNSLHGGRPPN
jgi:hypothetical protein